MFTKADLHRFGLTSAEVRHLERRRRGGESGGAGYRYQHHFAAVEVLKATADFLDGGPDAEVAEEGLCWVDDVVVRAATTRFFQLKIGRKDSWRARKGKLQREFLSQHKLCLAASVGHQLHVVTPHKGKVAQFNARAPSAIKSVFSAEYFPQQRLRRDLWAAGGPAYNVVRRICAANPDSHSQRELVAAKLISEWEDSGSPTDPKRVSAVLARAWADPEVPIRRKTFAEPTAWSAAVAAVAGVSGLSLVLRDGFAFYEYIGLSGARQDGMIGACDGAHVSRVLDRLVSRPPSTFDEFWREL